MGIQTDLCRQGMSIKCISSTDQFMLQDMNLKNNHHRYQIYLLTVLVPVSSYGIHMLFQIITKKYKLKNALGG
jgi:hypothetical protein